MITEKAYALGKFARVAIGTKHIDYNGRLCMVSAGTALQADVWHRSGDESLARSDEGEGCSDRRFQRGRIARLITTHYLWQCRENGGRLIVVDPRMTPISRNADLYLPVRPGPIWRYFWRCCTSSFEMGARTRTYIARNHHRMGCSP